MLENKLGITTALELAEAEEKISKKKAVELFENGMLDKLEAGKFASLKAIHKYLFEDIYDFAGEMRTVNISKGNFRFAPLMYLEAALENTSGAIYDEFSLMLKEHRLGLELPIAINNMTQRNDSENLQLFALTISVCMKTGGSMVDVLEHVVATIRQRGEFQDKVKTMVAQSKFEALAISLSPLAALLILYAVKPDFVYPMLVHPIGWCAMAFVCFWEIIGFIIIKRVVTVKF